MAKCKKRCNFSALATFFLLYNSHGWSSQMKLQLNFHIKKWNGVYKSVITTYHNIYDFIQYSPLITWWIFSWIPTKTAYSWVAHLWGQDMNKVPFMSSSGFYLSHCNAVCIIKFQCSSVIEQSIFSKIQWTQASNGMSADILKSDLCSATIISVLYGVCNIMINWRAL